MKQVWMPVVGAALFGGLVYMLLRWLWPQIAPDAFTNVIGAAAVLGSLLGLALARHSRKED
jgi:uncharacterized membrane protein YedE/YeeE